MTKIFKSLSTLLTVFILLFFAEKTISCSMYKLTVNGKTMVGGNYDAYYLTTKIWFENGKPGEYGAVFSGARYDGANGFAPQSGMNEFGLAFSGAAAPPSEKKGVIVKPGILSRTAYLKDILHKCKTVEEVKTYISRHDYGYFTADVFLFADKSGKYLIVEPDTMTTGNEPKCVLSNFCPSVTKESDALKMARYRKGVEFLKNKIDTSLAFCTALSDTMHVCREKIGDGTLLTCIRDLNEGILYYYFYHDYKHPVKFNLKDELSKGDHMYEVPKLFPLNAEYEKLRNYKTPMNSPSILAFMLISVVIFLFSALFFLISFFRKRKTARYSYLKLIVFALGISMSFYALLLTRNENVFYFPAPYGEPLFAAYIPFAALLLIIPLAIFNRKIFKDNTWGRFSKWLFTLTNILYLLFIILFGYWGLFNIF
ncbi:MAG: hypothetical protein K0S33_2130 [Bacteroidetes bacterium]|jgi:hypothetical protein|nr:hypothetical protein [Bacteroidota bacterium]